MNTATIGNTMNNQSSDIKPWYKQFWPWFLISLPLSAVIAGIATILIAMHEPDGVVVDDYYKKGLAINKTLNSEKMAQQLNIAVAGEIINDTIRLTLTGNIPVPEELSIQFIHPTKPNNDKNWTLKPNGAFYSATITPLAATNWHVKVVTADGHWRLSGRFNPQQSSRLELSAN